VLKYKYKLNFKPHFIEPEAQKGYEDVTLLALDGNNKYTLNVCVFASLSRMCREMVDEAVMAESELRIHTELSHLELYKIINFAKTGKLYGYQTKDEVVQDQNMISIFKDFGVDLSRLEFTDKSVRIKWATKWVEPKKPAAALKEEALEEIVVKGELDFLEDDVKPVMTMEDDNIDTFDEPDLGCIGDYDEDYDEKPPVLPIPGMDCFVALNDIGVEEDRVNLRPKKRKNGSDDEWLPDSDEDLPLQKKAKKKVVKPEPKPKSDNASGAATKMFYFPQDEDLRKKHMPFQCHLCVRGFKKNWTLKQHILRHGAKSEKDRFFCLFCQGKYVAFLTMEEHDDHVDSVHKGKPLQCENCDFFIKDIRNIRDMYRHIRENHDGGVFAAQRVQKLTCVACGSVSPSTLHLKIHQKRFGPLHDGKCRICDNFEAKTWDENKSHYDNVHNGDIQHKCGYCPAFFDRKTDRIKHVKQECPVQLGDPDGKVVNKPFQKTKDTRMCPHCGKELSEGHLQNHIDQVHGTYHIPCTEPGCNVILKHPDAVKRHVASRHVSVVCEDCGWVGAKKHLARHVRSKHTKDEKKPHVCKVCGKGFVEPQTFNDHMNVHTGAKPHKCPICFQGFASNATMYGHLRGVHQGKKRK